MALAKVSVIGRHDRAVGHLLGAPINPLERWEPRSASAVKRVAAHTFLRLEQAVARIGRQLPAQAPPAAGGKSPRPPPADWRPCDRDPFRNIHDKAVDRRAA